MRRMLIAVVAAGLAAAVMASPALASSRSHHRFSGASVTAVWRSKTRLSSTSFRLTIWFVGVFPSASGTPSQVFKDVAKCKVVSGRRRCREVSFSVGFSRNLTAKQFSFDRKHLTGAHLDATYTLRTFVPHKPVRKSRATIVATWTGTGKITHNGGVDNFHSGCLHFHDTFHGRNRSATATGSVNGKSLGTTKNASLSTSTDIFIQHRC